MFELINVQWIGHLSFALAALSFGLKDMLMLRLIAIVSSMVGVVYNYYVANGPRYLPIFWLSLFALINIARIIHLVWERRQVTMTPEEAEIYDTQFSTLTPVEFYKLTRAGKWLNFDPDSYLARYGEKLERLMLIYNGEVKVYKAEKEIASCRDGALIGEVSFLRKGTATADVKATMPTKCLTWDSDELRNLLKRNPTMNVAMQSVLSADLTKKLMT